MFTAQAQAVNHRLGADVVAVLTVGDTDFQIVGHMGCGGHGFHPLRIIASLRADVQQEMCQSLVIDAILFDTMTWPIIGLDDYTTR